MGPHDSGKGAILRRICEIDSDAPGRLPSSLRMLEIIYKKPFRSYNTFNDTMYTTYLV